MNSIQLKKLLSEHTCTAGAFGGVFPVDRLPTIMNNFPALFIVNTDDSSEPGSHWVCVYIASPEWGYFFDSYGFAPSFWDGRLEQFMQRHTNIFSWNTNSFQPLDSDTCGEWCLHAGDSMCRQRPQTDHEVKLQPLTDHQLRHWIVQHFNTVKSRMITIDCDYEQQTCTCMKVNLCNRRFIL